MYKIILNLILCVCLIRGTFVFDMGGSAEGTNTTASAICLVAAAISAGFLHFIQKKVIDIN